MSYKFNPFSRKPDYYEAGTTGSVDDVARDNIINLAWRLAIAESLSVFNLEDGVVDEFEDETGVDTGASTNEQYDGTGDCYAPASGSEVDNMEYASDALAQAAYVTNCDPDDGTGGTITHSGGYTIHTFTSNGTFNPGHEREVEYLIVAGGGGGGYNYDGFSTAGGGGGAGGIISNSDTVSGDKSVVVGAGGAGSCTNDVNGTNGNNSSFNGETATGGGGGATYIGGSGTGRAGGNGGSGGGGSYGGAGGTGVAGQGYAGGAGSTGTGQPGGGGGGASEVGTAGASGAHGGDGVTSSISGSSVTYGGGGGGGIVTGTAGNGGAGGGGAGGSGSTPGGDGTDGLGGGGGAGGTGGDGGDGVVIIRYLTTYTILQAYSESTIKTQGSYSLKGIAVQTNSLNKTLTRNLASAIDLSGVSWVQLYFRSDRASANVTFGWQQSISVSASLTPSLTSAGSFERFIWSLDAISNGAKNSISALYITLVNADASNTFYVDGWTGPLTNMTLISESTEAEEQPTEARFLALVEPVDTITVNTDIKGYVSEDDGSNYDQVTLTDEGYFDSTKKILAGNVTLTDRSDKTMVQKIETANNKDLKVHAWGLLWS